MSATLSVFLHGALPPVQSIQDDPFKKYKWVYSKSDEAIHYVEVNTTRDEYALEKIYKVMEAKLRGYQEPTSSISKEERNRLTALKARVMSCREKYKKEHDSIFGKIYLLFKGFFNGGHINKVTQNLVSTIDSLVEKPLTPNVEDLETFLKVVAPIVNDFEISMLVQKERKWVYHRDTGVVEDKEYADGDQILPMEETLGELAKQLSVFDGVKETTRAQKYKLEAFKVLVETREPKETQKRQEVLAKIDRLIQIEPNENEINSDEIIQKMQELSNKTCQELLRTEKTFLYSINKSIGKLIRLGELKDISYSSRYRKFFQDKKKEVGCLADCIEAFRALRTLTEPIVAQLEEALKSPSIEQRNKAIAGIYTHDNFYSYVKQMARCARYYPLLSALEEDLLKRNEKDGKIKPYFSMCEGGNPTAYYITTVQRLPRHEMLLSELTKQTPGPFNDYKVIYGAYAQALSYSANLNRRMDRPLHF